MWQRFSPASRAVILRAQQLAQTHQNHFVSPAHLFLAILNETAPDCALYLLLRNANLKIEEARLYASATLEPSPDFSLEQEPRLTGGARRVLELAAEEARDLGDNSIEPEHLLFGCLRPQHDETLLQVLSPLGWNVDDLRWSGQSLELEEDEKFSDDDARAVQHPLRMLTGGTERALDAAYAAMRATFCGRISTAHLLLGLLEFDNYAVQMLVETGASAIELKQQARASIRSDGQLATHDKRFDKGAKRALDRAKVEAKSRGYKFIGTDHILLGLLPTRATTREMLTWGTRVEDEAARALANVDAAKLRVLAGPLPVKKSVSVFDAHAMPMWTLGFLIETTCCLAGFDTRHRSAGQGMAEGWGVVLGLVAAFELLGIWLKSKSKTKTGPRTLFAGMMQNFFLGALMGFAAGLALVLARST